jgi:chemotaxis protein CheZ
MEKNLLLELKNLLNLIETFKGEISSISEKKRGINLATSQIDTAISESEEATKKLIDSFGESLEEINSLIELTSKIEDRELRSTFQEKLTGLLNRLTQNLTLLEFQDILAQRLLKVKDFLTDLEKSILKIALLAGIEEKPAEEKELRRKMEELEWKKEVSQEDVDEIMKQFGL